MDKRYKIYALVFVAIIFFAAAVFACAREMSAAIGNAVASMLGRVEGIAFGYGEAGENDEVSGREEKPDKDEYGMKSSDAKEKYESIDRGAQTQDHARYTEDGITDMQKPDARDADDIEGAISAEQARQIALDAVGLNEEDVKYITCYVMWEKHVPYAYEVKFAGQTAPYDDYHYTIDLYTGEILDGCCSCHK